MKLKCLGSSSKGNCYLLIGGSETLIIEAGVNFKKVKEALDFDLSNVVGCLVSHEHGDHFNAAKDMSNAGIDVYSNRPVINKIGSGYVMIKKRVYGVGNFEVYTIRVIHDVETFAFMIMHPEMGRLLFVADTAQFNYSFKGINHLLIEANYDEDIVAENAINNPNAFNNIERLEKSHMSLKECEIACGNNVGPGTKNIVLIHLSSGNSDQEMFKGAIKKKTGKPVYVAEEGFEIEL